MLLYVLMYYSWSYYKYLKLMDHQFKNLVDIRIFIKLIMLKPTFMEP